MKVQVVRIDPPTKGAALCSAKIQLQFEDGETLVIDDIRVLKNIHSELWLGYPSRMMNGAYVQLVFPSYRLKRMIEDAVIPAFKQWYTAQQSSQQSSQEGPAPSPRSTPAREDGVR